MKNASLLCVLSLNFEGKRSVFGAATAEMSCEIPMPSYCMKQKPLLSCEITQIWGKKNFFPHIYL